MFKKLSLKNKIKKYKKSLIPLQTIFNYNHICPVCNKLLEVENINVICDELVNDWSLSYIETQRFNFREGSLCKYCGSSVRIRNLARAFLDILNIYLNINLQSMEDLKNLSKLIDINIAEINNCATLHKYLINLPKLFYSEYGSKDINIRNENLLNLTYKDDCFDIVIMTDVLEHVPDIEKALSEISRVLKQDGYFLFTVPFLLNRNTKKRAYLDKNGKVKYIEKPSYHGDYNEKMEDYLVFYEFGVDFIKILQKHFDVKIYHFNDFGKETTNVFCCIKR